jgi:hypothetical protein
MKEAADSEKFRNFAEAHRRRIYQKMVARVRRRHAAMTSTPLLWVHGAYIGIQKTRVNPPK